MTFDEKDIKVITSILNFFDITKTVYDSQEIFSNINSKRIRGFNKTCRLESKNFCTIIFENRLGYRHIQLKTNNIRSIAVMVELIDNSEVKCNFTAIYNN